MVHEHIKQKFDVFKLNIIDGSKGCRKRGTQKSSRKRKKVEEMNFQSMHGRPKDRHPVKRYEIWINLLEIYFHILM